MGLAELRGKISMWASSSKVVGAISRIQIR
jgi:hypothetical protein